MCFNQFVHRINCGANMQNVRGMPPRKIRCSEITSEAMPGAKIEEGEEKNIMM